MAERISPNPESIRPRSPEHHRERAEHKEALKPHHEHEHKGEHKEQAPVRELERRAHHEAKPAAELFSAPQERKQEQTAYVSRELKKQTLDRTLTRVRKQLSAPGRVLSKVVHQPTVDAISQVGGQTVARPSGLLGGSLVAFLGSSSYLWLARHYGFTYNYLLFAFLFIGGFALGMTIELLVFIFRRKRA